jgi:nanoRNase/pAp phosphatase (c-di-AMP/oligoRNAs hydrolase)
VRSRSAWVGGGSADTVLVVEALGGTLQSIDPFVLTLLAVATVAVGGGSWRLFRWLRRSRGARFQRVLARHESAAVLMHPNPDPDAMACAMAVAEIAASVDTEATIQYSGEIRHQENRAFRTVLELDGERIEAASELAADAVVLVDHNTPRGFTDAQLVEPVAVIDHHPGNGTGTEWTDVRTDYGAASTILVEYLDQLGATDDVGGEDEDRPVLSTPLATGLCYGILADTNHLTSGCSRAEFDACRRLYDRLDQDLLDRVANPQVSDDVLQIKARAIMERRIEGSFAVCDVGTVGNTDAIPQAADELLQLEGITAVVVYGDRDGTIHLSGRSRDDRVHMGETLRHTVNDIPTANAGGHARMGGGQLSADRLAGIGSASGVCRGAFEDRLFAAMAGTRQ